MQDVCAGQHAGRREPVAARRARHDAHLVVFGQVRDDDVEHEAIELRFRQRVGSFELDRILGRQHEERPVEGIRAAGRRHVIFLHRLEQRRLRLGRCAVDLVGQNDLRKNRDIDILLAIDSSSFPLGTGPKQHEIWHSGYYPVAWTNTKYRMIYDNMGHNDIDYINKTYKELSFQFANDIQNRFIIDALFWLAGKKTPAVKN